MINKFVVHSLILEVKRWQSQESCPISGKCVC